MLQAPYNKYTRIFFYILELSGVPEISDPDCIGFWAEDNTVMLFFHREKKDLIERICRQYSCSVIYEADMHYDEWENDCEIMPFSVGGLTVAPVWNQGSADIFLDPSVVFGNGFHPTTRLCLEALVDLLPDGHSFSTALDLGCGTGLLAIAAAYKGMSDVLALDNNSLACQVARKNAALNNLHTSIVVKEHDLTVEVPDTEVDLVTVNLHHELLVQLFQDSSFWRAKYYIISGFLTHREDILLAALPTEKIRFMLRKKREKWAMWVLEKKD